MKIKKKDR